MNRSVSKIRHIQRLNERVEKRFLNEDDEDPNEELNTLIKYLEDMVSSLQDCGTIEKCSDSQNNISPNIAVLVRKLNEFNDQITNAIGL
jgi:hypothetical protein